MVAQNEQDNLARVMPTSTAISYSSSRLGSPRNMSADSVVNGVSVIELEWNAEQVLMSRSQHMHPLGCLLLGKPRGTYRILRLVRLMNAPSAMLVRGLLSR